MKKPVAALAAIALIAGFSACDSHSWEDSEDGKTPGTKRLFPKPGSHGGGHAEHEGGNAEEGHDGAKEGHADAKDGEVHDKGTKEH